jgi:hypothetical protein
VVPLHADLVEQGFPAWVERQPSGPLFHHRPAKPSRRGWQSGSGPSGSIIQTSSPTTVGGTHSRAERFGPALIRGCVTPSWDMRPARWPMPTNIQLSRTWPRR